MPPASKTPQTRRLRKQILNILADLYLFPQSDRGLASALRERFPGLEKKQVRDCFAYLEKKGYVALNSSPSGAVTALVTSSGIDVVEGAVPDRGVLPTAPDFAGLASKREIRGAVMAYCRQFPESFNGDDEIHAALKDMGMTNLLLDQTRYHIWYLAGKELLEMRTHPLHGDLLFLARITARGIDLLDGSVTDPGVSVDD